MSVRGGPDEPKDQSDDRRDVGQEIQRKTWLYKPDDHQEDREEAEQEQREAEGDEP
ncbi:MAG: hypothetical protein ACE5LU_17885 [Anaerolineae bacterium]